jgi:ferritin-like metal-binding protein YciE
VLHKTEMLVAIGLFILGSIYWYDLFIKEKTYGYYRQPNKRICHDDPNALRIEKQLEKALPKMAKAATNPDLVKGFKTHLEETKGHSKRLEEIFKMMEMSPKKFAGEGIRGIIADGGMIAEADAPEALKDAKLAAAGRDVEHYEMACYMNAIEEAKGMGLSEVVMLLQQNLAEEQTADKKLTVALKDSLKLAKKAI